jgi:hypothetical protein
MRVKVKRPWARSGAYENGTGNAHGGDEEGLNLVFNERQIPILIQG